VLAGNTSDRTTVKDFLAKIEKQYGKARRTWVMDRGVPTEAVLAEMRAAATPVHYLAGTPRGRLTQLEQSFLARPWSQAREQVQVKLVERDGEVYVLARSHSRRDKERAMRRRRLKQPTKRLKDIRNRKRLTRDLDDAVRKFHWAPLEDDWAYLFLDGVSLRVRRPSGRQRVHMLVAYGVRANGTRQLLAFLRTQGESQAAWEGLLEDLYRRGLQGERLRMIVTDGCPGLAAAIQTVYPRALHQRCWAHKMRNILEKVRKRDRDEVKQDAQRIYLADGRRQAEAEFRRFRKRWREEYSSMVRQLERDLPELLSFFSLPRHLWRKLRTANIIERCFVEVRRRTRPMVCFVNVASVDRIIYSIFHRFNLEWKFRTLRLFTQAA
jgi:transposase-like protein